MTRHLGRLWAVPHYRVSPVALACGLFRIDGSGDEYAGGICGAGVSLVGRKVLERRRR